MSLCPHSGKHCQCQPDEGVPCADKPAAPSEAPNTYAEIQALADAFTRSADWLQHGTLSGPSKTHPLVGLADYRRTAQILRAAAWIWATSDSEG